jgi:hypothetical protein
VLIVNVPEEVLAASASVAGTVSPCVLLVRVTDAPEDGAGLERVRAQELVEFAVRLDEAHCREETRAGETSAIEALADVPFRVAVMMAF